MSEHERLDDLVERHLRNELSGEEKQQLAALLDSDAEATQQFVQRVELVSALASVLRHTDAEEQDSGMPALRIRLPIVLPWTIATVFCIAAAIAWLPLLFERKPSIDTPAQERITALLVNEADASFASDRDPAEVKFGPGTYELQSGAIHLRFANGADMVLAAPAQLDIRDAFHTRLHYGKVRAMVPSTAHGFTIAAHDVNYEDIGTEFGLSVDPSTGNSDLHVFDGQVNVRRGDSSELLSSVLQGHSVRYVDGQTTATQDIQPDEYLTPGAIGFLRWKTWKQELLEDPSLIGYFPFAEQDDISILANLKTDSGVTDGKISGARWVSGRWPGKRALLFDRDSDFVELTIPGEHQELTIAVWLQMDRFDNALNAIFNSNDWDDGDIHFQLTRQGLPYGDVNGSSVALSNRTWLGNPIPTAKWTHVVSVMSENERACRLYINGRLVLRCPFRQQGELRPGVCRLGNWKPLPGFEPVRSLQGRIDELAIWERALSEEEVKQLMEKGRPSFFWSPENPGRQTSY